MDLTQLVELSRHFGSDPDYVLAGGGNTSVKDENTLFVKASGTSLATINESGFVALDRRKMTAMDFGAYSSNPDEREEQIKNDLATAKSDPNSPLRPSVEASLHNLLNVKYVVHTHPWKVNALMCGNNGRAAANHLFPDRALIIPYINPGFTLFKHICEALSEWRKIHSSDPELLFLENHGVFVNGDTPEKIRSIYGELAAALDEVCPKIPSQTHRQLPGNAADLMPTLRMLLSEDSVKAGTCTTNPLIDSFIADKESFATVNGAFTPDQIVYCKSRALFLERNDDPEKAVADFKERNGFLPKIVGIEGIGIAVFEENISSAETVLSVFEDAMKICLASNAFGGPRFMNAEQVAFIDNWEVENYRRKVAKSGSRGKVNQKIAVVTGGAQGFGGGIVEELFAEGANVVIADLNQEKGQGKADRLNSSEKKNRALFIQTDVSSAESVEDMIRQTCTAFGGLDIYVSNAGILRAGSLEEMTPETFELMTRVNYSAFFLGAKFASAVMKKQHTIKPEYMSDIIQINSKSGLAGSNKNFAYAGGKFGGIGLTQSFALELMEFGIKVNSICPGNFFDGPLWSDPEKGLFVQYLKTGKVPGAKTIADVKAFYEKKVPAKRGCTVRDVMRAIFYVIEQEYETGQAVPVTGGQVMLN